MLAWILSLGHNKIAVSLPVPAGVLEQHSLGQMLSLLRQSGNAERDISYGYSRSPGVLEQHSLGQCSASCASMLVQGLKWDKLMCFSYTGEAPSFEDYR